MIELIANKGEALRLKVLSEMINALKAIHPLSEELFSLLYLEGKFERFAKGKYISSPLDRSHRLVFISTGVAHLFKKNSRDNHTLRLLGEGTFVLQAMISENGSYLQSIDPVAICSVPAQKIVELAMRDNCTGIVLRELMRRELEGITLSNMMIKVKSLPLRLAYFRKTHPVYEGRIPLKYISSYLGIAVETLIRLRKNEEIDGKD